MKNVLERNFIAQTGDPTSTGRGGESIFSRIYGDQAAYFEAELKPRLKHEKLGTLSMVNNGNNMNGSQFFFTLGENLTYLDEVHTVFGEIVEGLETLLKINEAICDPNSRPYQDIRITHTVVLHDPYDDPPGLELVDSSPIPTKEQLESNYIGADEEIDDTKGKNAEEIEEKIKENEAKARATILEMVGDIPDADVKPPENVLFVCKLNPVTTSEDLEIIFSRFGHIVSCEVIKDKKSGESLQYAFIEFEKEEDCENAYFKMDNVLIDDRRIHVDFSQSVSKLMYDNVNNKFFEGRNTRGQKFVIKSSEKKSDGYDMVFDMNNDLSDSKHRRCNSPHKYDENSRSRHSFNRNNHGNLKDIQTYSNKKSKNYVNSKYDKHSNPRSKYFSHSISRSPSPSRSHRRSNYFTKDHKIARNCHESSNEIRYLGKVSSKISKKMYTRNHQNSSSSGHSVSPSFSRRKNTENEEYSRSKHYSSSSKGNHDQKTEKYFSSASYKDTYSKNPRSLKSKEGSRQNSKRIRLSSCSPESSNSEKYESKHDLSHLKSVTPEKRKDRCHSPKLHSDKYRSTKSKVPKSSQCRSSSSDSSSSEKKQSYVKSGTRSYKYSSYSIEKSPEISSQRELSKNAKMKDSNRQKSRKSYNSSDSELDARISKSKQKTHKSSYSKTHKHSHKRSRRSYNDVTLPEATFNIVSSETNLIPKSAVLSTTQQAQLDAIIGKFADVFYSHDDNIGLCPYVEFEIELQHDKPIRCRPHRLSEPDRQFLNSQIQKWLKQRISRPSNSPYPALAFIVDQPFHESTPRRVVVDFSRTINSITKIDPHPIDQMEDAIKRTADAAEENIEPEPCIEFNQPIVTQNSPF
ncbi:peptidyl-prolyl cis-trans isomerase-like 4 [Nephila pilipes]|uniref:peptidylprolyl isomerase n=1 Tax=Nephila pilipes TaxID=299642 RepID=A0A8X6MGD6_NEPPI|nr:peptidyl-prolyl cis-trans isomerase-like 4 [Nephila pilipes]